MPPRPSGRGQNNNNAPQTVGVTTTSFLSRTFDTRTGVGHFSSGWPTDDEDDDGDYNNNYLCNDSDDARACLVPATAAYHTPPSLDQFKNHDQQNWPDQYAAPVVSTNAFAHLAVFNSPAAHNKHLRTEHLIQSEVKPRASQLSQSLNSLHVPSIAHNDSARSTSPSPIIFQSGEASAADALSTRRPNLAKHHYKPHWLTAHTAQSRARNCLIGGSDLENRMSEGVRAQSKQGEDGESSRSYHAATGRSGQSSISGRSQSEDQIKSDYTDSVLSAQENRGAGRPPSILRQRVHGITHDEQWSLPAEKGFPIQIGSELFRLSGASIMSDAPSYFSRFFEEQLRQNEDGSGGVRTLFIDRDPTTFQDICRHLQGYHVQPRDSSQYVRLFADAQFYSLPRLISQLFESEIFIRIGDQDFSIPRDIFSAPGDSPNFFSFGFAIYFSTPKEVFPGLERTGLLRPPSIMPPCIPGRSGYVFRELLHLLRGYPLHIKDDEHRQTLLRDCRYYHLRGLEQKLIYHHISRNVERDVSEIVIRLEDIRQSGISFVGDASPSDASLLGGWVNYARPWVDDSGHQLIVEIGGGSTKVNLSDMQADFHGESKARIASLFQVVANKMNLPTKAPLGLMMSAGGAKAQPVSPGNTPLSGDQVKIYIEPETHVVLDGEEHSFDDSNAGIDESNDFPFLGNEQIQMSEQLPAQLSRPPSAKPPPRKRKRYSGLDEFGEWVIRRGQWRMRVQPCLSGGVNDMEIVLHAVKLEAISGQRRRNAQRGFLA